MRLPLQQQRCLKDSSKLDPASGRMNLLVLMRCQLIDTAIHIMVETVNASSLKL
jgi:hypothetical protein